MRLFTALEILTEFFFAFIPEMLEIFFLLSSSMFQKQFFLKSGHSEYFGRFKLPLVHTPKRY